jgi:hypothetical protein
MVENMQKNMEERKLTVWQAPAAKKRNLPQWQSPTTSGRNRHRAREGIYTVEKH